MKKIILLIIKGVVFSMFIFILGCTKTNNLNITNEKNDSIIKELDKSLLYLKNNCLIECLEISEKESFLKKGVDVKASCFKSIKINDLTRTVYVQTSSLNLKWIFEDKRRKRLVNKYAKMDYIKKYEIYLGIYDQEDLNDNSLNMMKALDLYNSKELEDYIDSVRCSEIKKLEIENP